MDDTTTLMLAGLTIIVLAIIIVMMALRRRRSEKLKAQFGPEYQQAVQDEGGRRKAEAELKRREARVKTFDIHPLSLADRERFVGFWRSVQSEFVDNPDRAVLHADELVEDVMAAQGYPMSDFDHVAADLSVDHPVVVQNYRAAHAIAIRGRQRGVVATEDLRQAMLHYRTLFDELVSSATSGAAHA